MEAVEKRRLVLLAPVYADVRSTSRCTAVELQRTSDDWLQLVFSTRKGPVEKEAACVNSHEGCRCDFVRLLRALVVLTERQIVSVRGVYVITIIDHTPVATLEFKVKVCNNARNYVGESLKNFELVLCHLQSDALAIARRSEKSRNEAKNSELLDATCSSCHVVGCRLHQWQVDETLGPKAKLHLPDVFQSLMAHMEAEQSEIRDDVVYCPKSNDSNVKITDLPKNALHLVVYFMDATELGAVSGVCSLFRHLAYAVVPGLNLVLYEHQRKGLKWMLYRETPSLIRSSTSHPFLFPRRPGRSSNVAIDLLDMKVVKDVDTTTRDLCGGMFCDEPGLGKTITMLALILRTKGQSTRNARLRAQLAEEATSANTGKYSLRPRDRSVAAEDLVSSGASLIVVPDPLVEHWKYQIEAHVDSGALRTFIDESGEELPSNLELAACDVVVTSFSRLAREWKRHRPASALEKRMPERYGFEGIQRYSDGTIRGKVSSLLTVRWVRVIVDEGHELGGQTPTNLMLMARTVSAERRWVMTGTPTPNTLQSADLNYVHGLLLFLRNKPYGQPDARAWTKAIAKPFEHNKPIGFYRLQSLLSRILMRHTKESIREILPEPVWHTVYIDPTPSEYAQYNVVAAAVRANLVITSVDPEKPGKQHLDSLLNPINRAEALQVVENLRFACCGGVNSEVVLPTKAQTETINMLLDLEVDADNIATVMQYLQKVVQPGMMTMCGSCKRKLQLLMVLPCGHLCCADCVEDRNIRIGPSCYICNEVFDPEVFIELQPGFEFREIDDANDKKAGGSGKKQRQGGQGHQHPPLSGRIQHKGQPRQLTEAPLFAGVMPRNRHYWTVDASKIFYAATRVRELKMELARQNALHGAGGDQRYAKVIIFSQFTEMIWRVKLAFLQQKIPTADFITLIKPKLRMRALRRFRENPAVNVLLLSEEGSHGLDLSFVTHVFLMEEIWDKSLETQVISRAHRMGAEQAVVIERLWMRGSVESDMAKVNGLSESEPVPPRVVHDLGPPARKFKRKHSGDEDTLLNVAGKKKHKRDHSDEMAKVPGNKSKFLQRKLDYVLNNLKLLDESIAAPPRQVRFSVIDEKTGTTIRQAIHTILSSDGPALTTSTSSSQPQDRRTTLQSIPSARPTENGGPGATASQRGGMSNQHQSSASVGAAATIALRAQAARKVVQSSDMSRNSAISSTQAVESVRGIKSESAQVAPRPAATATTHRERKQKRPRHGPQDVIVIDDEPETVEPRPPAASPATQQDDSNAAVILIDDSSSSEPDQSVDNDNESLGDRDSDNGSDSDSDSDSDASMASSSSSDGADNEDQSGSEDNDSGSDDSDEEGKALVSQLITVAQRHFGRHTVAQRRFARHREASDRRAAAVANSSMRTPALDDEETETESECSSSTS